jgi:hypothetical protein
MIHAKSFTKTTDNHQVSKKTLDAYTEGFL